MLRYAFAQPTQGAVAIPGEAEQELSGMATVSQLMNMSWKDVVLRPGHGGEREETKLGVKAQKSGSKIEP